MRRQKFLFAEHKAEEAPQAVVIENRKQPAILASDRGDGGDVLGEVRTIFDKPLHTAGEARQLFHQCRLQRFDRK